MNKIIYKKIAQHIEANEPCWLATIIHTEGSTPARVGMKMLVHINGELDGTVGGGAVEKKVIDKIMKEQPDKPSKWNFDLDGNSDFTRTGMICGGIQEILIEPLFNSTQLFIIGGGHCGKALGELASRCNFAVTIIDDRAEVATKANHPHANQVICIPYHDIARHINFSAETFIVAMTHGHKHDQLVMENILRNEYKYFGVIGSQQKVNATFAKLAAKGFSKQELQTIYSPIGFKIGSQTPMEVAISILSQLIAVKNDKTEIKFNTNVLL